MTLVLRLIRQSHWDLPEKCDWLAEGVFALTTAVWNKNLGPKRIDERRAVQFVAEAVRRGRILLEKLRPKLRDEVRSRIDANRDDPRKPK